MFTQILGSDILVGAPNVYSSGDWDEGEASFSVFSNSAGENSLSGLSFSIFVITKPEV